MSQSTQFSFRTLDESDAAIFREIRLEALVKDPSAFGSTYARESAQDLDFFRQRCRRSDSGFVIGAFAKDGIVGLAGIFREAHERRRHKAFVWTMYVRAEHRGSGLGRRLLDEAVQQAVRLDGVEQVQLSVNAANVPARELYVSYGFQSYGLERRAQVIDGEYHDEESFVFFPDKSPGSKHEV